MNKLLDLSHLDKFILGVSESLENNTNAAVALVIIATIVAAIVEVLFIVIRFASTGISFNKILVLMVSVQRMCLLYRHLAYKVRSF